MPPSADVIRADFDRIARVTAAAPDPGAGQPRLAPALEPAARRLFAHVPFRKQVLDIGCGTGVLARELSAKRGAKVTAIDIAPRMIDVARLRTSQTLGVDYRVADIMERSEERRVGKECRSRWSPYH